MKYVLFLGVFIFSCSSFAFAEEETVVADFDSGQVQNNFGGIVEIWLAGDGSDTSQFSKMSFVSDDALGNAAGKSLKIDYDVASENPAYNGVRTDLKNFDTTGHKALEFYIKGDAQAGFPKTLKVELIGDSGKPSPYIVNGVTAEWQKISIPVTEFAMIQAGSKIQKFVVVFADVVNDPKTGTVYLDQLQFSKAE